jgi:CBS domain-containing protein
MSDRVTGFLGRAAAEPVKLTVRDLLGIWGLRARTYEGVARIRRDLDAAGLHCEPDLGEGGGDTVIRVGLRVESPADDLSPDGGVADGEEQDEPLKLPPVALLVSHVPSASRPVERVSPGQSLKEAQALMSAHDYSQLAVLSGTRDLKGAVSWRSIAQARLANSDTTPTLADATIKHPSVVHAEEELLSQIHSICKAGFIFVRDEDDRICGIVTSADLGNQFRDLTTPFFELGEIEGRVRRCIDRIFNADELRAATGRNKVNSAADMTFGQYVHLLKDDTRWQRMHWDVDRAMFIGYLDAAREVRNRVMHFGEELQPDDKYKLRQCLNFMRALDPM